MSEAQKSSAGGQLVGAIASFLFFLVFEFLMMLGGLSIMFDSLTFLQNFLHLLGIMFTGWFLLDSWQYERIWGIWVLFGFFPFMVELYIFTSACMFKRNQTDNTERRARAPLR